MAMVLLLAVGAAIFMYEWSHRQPRRLSGKHPITKQHQDPWTKIVQKGQVIVAEPFTSIGGYAIACEGRDFMYAPDVHEFTHQMEHPQELPISKVDDEDYYL